MSIACDVLIISVLADQRDTHPKSINLRAVRITRDLTLHCKSEEGVGVSRGREMMPIGVLAHLH